MPNTSATGGPLLPCSPAPLADLDFDRVLSRLVRGIAGFADGMVRPRWQEKSPPMPPKDADWCAIGAERTRAETGMRGIILHDPADEGADTLRQYEAVEVLASFYGPNAAHFAGLVRDGLRIPQNREILFHANTALIDIGDVIPAPDLVNTTWRRRQDLRFRVRRRVDRTYPVRNLLSAEGTFHTEATDQTWSTGE